MADHFLTKSTVDRKGLIEVGERTAVESHRGLFNFLLAKGEEKAAFLFAEPVVSRGNDEAPPTVAWYVPGPASEVHRLAELPPEERQNVEAQLREMLTGIAAYLSDPEFGPLLGAALHIRSAEDIWVVDGRPVLTNWGVVEPEVRATKALRDRHFRSTLGPYLPFDVAPAISSSERQARITSRAGAEATTGGVTGVGMASTATVATGASAETPDQPAEEVRPRAAFSPWMFAPLVALIVILSGVFIWLLLPGTRLFPPPPAPEIVSAPRELAIIEEVNRSLEEQISRLEEALEYAQCTDTGELLLPDGRRPNGLLPETRITEGANTAIEPTAIPNSVIPPSPANIAIPQGPTGGDGSDSPATNTLLDHIEDRTVFVIAIGGAGVEGSGIGSGFFVGPDLVVTNDHVITGAASAGGRIFVINEALARVHPARLLDSMGPLEQAGGDFALLQVDGVQQPFYTLRNSTDTIKLQNVIAAGYPTAILSSDQNFQQLRNGDLTAIPALSVTDGIVNTEQDLGSPPFRVLVHSAPLSPGNSGGPLVDYCGRVVGVNTFQRQADGRLIDFALASTELIDFLAATSTAPTVSNAACAPMAMGPEPAGETEADDEN